MKRVPWKLPAVLAAALATSCAMTRVERVGGYLWVADPGAPHCDGVVWKQVQRDRIPGLCGDAAHAAPEGASCAAGCLVLSPYSERQAKALVLAGGDTLYRHERRHVLEGLIHP